MVFGPGRSSFGRAGCFLALQCPAHSADVPLRGCGAQCDLGCGLMDHDDKQNPVFVNATRSDLGCRKTHPAAQPEIAGACRACARKRVCVTCVSCAHVVCVVAVSRGCVVCVRKRAASRGFLRVGLAADGSCRVSPSTSIRADGRGCLFAPRRGSARWWPAREAWAAGAAWRALGGRKRPPAARGWQGGRRGSRGCSPDRRDRSCSRVARPIVRPEGSAACSMLQI